MISHYFKYEFLLDLLTILLLLSNFYFKVNRYYLFITLYKIQSISKYGKAINYKYLFFQLNIVKIQNEIKKMHMVYINYF